MIAARYTQGGKLQIEDVPMPAAGDGDLLLRVEASSICGTDLKMIRHGHRKLLAGQTITLGHEFVGTIERVGPQVIGLSAGMRIGVAPNIGCGLCEMCARGMGNMCPRYSAFGIDRDGSHTEYVCVPHAAIVQGSVIPLPEEVRAEDATLAEPLSCVINGLRNARVDSGDVVLVYGAGPMGLLHVMLAATSGAGRVVAVDPNGERLSTARRVGATDTVDPSRCAVSDWVLEETRGRGVDVAIIAAPVAHLQQEALNILAPFGRLCQFAGWPNGTSGITLDTNPIHYKNLLVTGVTGGSARDYAAALRLIAGGRIDVSSIVSDVFHLRDLAAAYAKALSGDAMKIVLTAAERPVRSASAREVAVR